MEKILDEESVAKIIELYKTSIPAIHKLGSMFKVNKKRISQILRDNNVPINKRGGQVVDGLTEIIAKASVIFYEPKEGKKLIAICKQTGQQIQDPNNYAGFLTKHINKLYGDVEIPSNNYQMKLYEYRVGKKWFEEYFDIQEVDANEVRKCKLCEWVTLDVKNKTGCYENHIKDVHNLSIQDYLKQFPEDSELHPTQKNEIKKELFLQEKDNFVICMLCNKKMQYINEAHLMSVHNITCAEYKLKFPNTNIMSDRLLKIFLKAGKDANINMTPTWTSKGEIELKDYIESLGLIVEKSRNRGLLDGKEIDLVIPSLKICIEYNGLYYHTEKMGKNSTYHLSKTLACAKNVYKLIHIFEDEWVTNNKLVKLKLSHIFGLSTGKILHARKLIIRPIETKVKSVFLDKFHIQGNDSSTISYGAFNENEFIGVMCFSKKRNMTSSGDGEYELTRFATNSNYIITGLASRLLKRFIKECTPNSIISFADRRWTLDAHNNMYTKMGFQLVNVGRPDYKYYNSKTTKHKRLHKFGFGLSQLKKKFPSIEFYHSDGTPKSERELTTELGYDRIWDCGLFKYKLTIN